MPTITEIKILARSKRRDVFYRLTDNLAYFPAKILLLTTITPNQITVLWILGQLIASVFLASGKYWTMVIALLIFQAMFILDCTDGIIARYKKKFSLNGIYLDIAGHYIANSFLLICYGIGVAKYYENFIYAVLGLIAVLVFLLNKAITLNPAWYPKNQQKAIYDCSKESMLLNERRWLYYIFAAFRLEYMFNIMFWGTLFRLANYVLIVYTIFFILELGRKILMQFVKNYRKDKELSSND